MADNKSSPLDKYRSDSPGTIPLSDKTFEARQRYIAKVVKNSPIPADSTPNGIGIRFFNIYIYIRINI